MGATLNILLKKPDLTRCHCASGVLTETLALFSSASHAVIDASTPYDPVLAVRLRHFQADADAAATLADPLPLLRAMLLTTAVASGVQLAQYIERWRNSVGVALLTRALAERSGLVSETLAWLAGLTHNLADYVSTSDTPVGSNDPTAAERSADCVRGLDEDGWWADAVRFHALPLARGKTAHPLIRLVQLAYVLVTRPQAIDSVDVRTALTALGIAAAEGNVLLNAMHTEVHALALRFDLLSAQSPMAGSSYFKLTRQYAQQAARSEIHSYLSSAFTGNCHASVEERSVHLQQTLQGALRMLFGVERVGLYTAQANGTLQASTMFDPPPALARLTLRHDDAHSLLALAFAQRQALRFDRREPDYSVIDAQIARILDAESFLCQPVVLEQQQPALLLCGGVMPDEHPLWVEFVAEWGAAFQRLDASPTAIAPTLDAHDAIPRERIRRAIHEVSNPLTIMRNYVNLLSARPGTDASVQRDLGIIGTEIERVARIVRGIASDELASETATESASINTLISELVRMTLGTLLAPNKISVQIDLNPEVQPMPLHKDALKQVLFNLAKNAVEAMSEGGHLSFSTRLIVEDGRHQVEIEIADTGPGLPEHVSRQLQAAADSALPGSPPNLAAPYSNKGGDHAGLGLPISRRLVARMGGVIDYTTSGLGTRFLIRLPITLGSGQPVAESQYERRY
jgi:signal transduction histidine kinase